MAIIVRAAPSLALMKYWGKRDSDLNIPDTTSIAVTVDGPYVEVALHERTGGAAADHHADLRMQQFFHRICQQYEIPVCYDIQVKSNIPYAAGFAGSSAAFAALSYATSKLMPAPLPLSCLSSLARQGSASAARAVYGGFVCFRAGNQAAEPLFPASHWPSLRILFIQVSSAQKPLSSREAMEYSRRTSPFYTAWIEDARKMEADFFAALRARDMEKLGQLMRLSTYRMFSVMLSSNPPIRYWQAGTMQLLSLLETLRTQGLGAWETMDAGPQVKVLVAESEVAAVLAAVDEEFPAAKVDVCKVAERSLMDMA